MSLTTSPRTAARIVGYSAGRIAALLLSLLIAIGPTSAHEGHDHGPAAPPLPISVKPRVAVQSDAYELVAIANGAQLTILLDRYGTNEPVPDAAIEVLADATTYRAEARPDGSYSARIPELGQPGRHELVFTIVHPSGNDLLAGTFDATAFGPPAAATVPSQPTRLRSWLVTGLPIVLALLGGIVIGYKTHARRALSIVLALGICVFAPTIPVSAHEGHEPSPPPASDTLSGETPRRLSDGSVFLPKASQRLLSIRNQIAIEGRSNRGVTLVGRIIPDPNRSGVVQSITGGRVTPPAGGLPLLGQAVKRDDLLVSVIPALPLADQSTLAEKQRELEGALLLARQKLSRLNRLGGNITPRSNIEDTELEVANLEHRLASLKAAKVQPELLKAPIDGIVSTSRVVAGQVVQAQDILFQIVDPDSLWVEALVFDQLDPGTIAEASAITPDGSVMRLSYRGRGRALQAQAVLIQFAIDKPIASAVLGLPVTVIARKSDSIMGILLPRDAIVRGPAGESMVWQHIDPERFVTRQVRIEPYDGEQVLVTGGIAPKDRIVVHGAELISQIR